MTKKLNIEKTLYPKKDKLIIEDGIIKTTIVDCELDSYECTFGEQGVEINTEGYTHITLDINDLDNLIFLIMDAEEMYFKLNLKK